MSVRELHVICAMSDAPRDLKYRHFITFREQHLRSHSVYMPGFDGILKPGGDVGNSQRPWHARLKRNSDAALDANQKWPFLNSE